MNALYGYSVACAEPHMAERLSICLKIDIRWKALIAYLPCRTNTIYVICIMVFHACRSGQPIVLVMVIRDATLEE